MLVPARIKAPVAETSLVAERGRRGCGLRLVNEGDNTVEQSFYDVAVIGLGYVGLPLAVEFGKFFYTIGFDISKKRIFQNRMVIRIMKINIKGS